MPGQSYLLHYMGLLAAQFQIIYPSVRASKKHRPVSAESPRQSTAVSRRGWPRNPHKCPPPHRPLPFLPPRRGDRACVRALRTTFRSRHWKADRSMAYTLNTRCRRGRPGVCTFCATSNLHRTLRRGPKHRMVKRFQVFPQRLKGPDGADMEYRPRRGACPDHIERPQAGHSRCMVFQ